MQHPCRHPNQTPVSERGELHFSSLALNLQTSHGASNCIAHQTQKCTHKQHETRGRGGGLVSIKHAPGMRLARTCRRDPRASRGGGARGAAGTLRRCSLPLSPPRSLHRPPSRLRPRPRPPGRLLTSHLALR